MAVRGIAVCGVMFAGVMFAIGCSTAPVRSSAGERPSHQASAETIARKLTAGVTEMAVRIRVTNTTRVGAFSWPDGTVELTSALVERLDENELAAAIAHELGHVLGGHSDGAASALSGEPGAPNDVEARADFYATRLLARAGYPPEALARTLSKVMEGPGLTPAARARLANRIALLTSAR